MKETFKLQNVNHEGCAQNVKMCLMMIDGVQEVILNWDKRLVDVLFDAPATALRIREQLQVAGYLSE